MCLKALLAASQGAQHLSGCIPEQLVCVQPLSFPTHWDGDAGSTPAKHLNTFLNFNCALRTSEGMITHVPKREQHRKSQPKTCGNAHRSVWGNVFHMCLRESCPVTVGAIPGLLSQEDRRPATFSSTFPFS